MNKDKIYMVLAFLSFIIILVIVIINYNPSISDKQFVVGDYYIPSATNSKYIDERSLFSEMSGSISIRKCPVVDIKKTNGGTIGLNNLGDKYQKEVYFISCRDLGQGTSNTNLIFNSWETDDSTKTIGIKEILKLEEDTNNNSSSTSPYKILPEITLAKGETDSRVWEIIAPFSFDFNNCNVTDSNKIIIINYAKDFRITFDNVVNWYCSGPIGTISVNNKAWEEHNSSHFTIIGNSANSEVKSGNAGDVIGYANYNTTVTIEYLNNGSWTRISVKDWLISNK